MCGRYYRKSDNQRIAEAFSAGATDDLLLAPNYNIAPTTLQPIIRPSRDTDDGELVLARWGLVSFFAKSLTDFKGFSTFNARAESIPASATWRGPFKTRRCIVPVNGAISFKSGEPMAFAALWDAWKEPKKSPQDVDTWLQSFSIITTEANETMSQIHARMPVILAERDWKHWLDRDPDAPPLIDLLLPLRSDASKPACCKPLVGNVRNNGPEMLNGA